MGNEQKIVLQMVAEGKITPDEGARILSVLSGQQSSSRAKARANRTGYRRHTSVSSEDPFGVEDRLSPKIVPLTEETSLLVKSHIASITIKGTDSSEVSVSGAPRSGYTLTQEKGQMQIKVSHPIGNMDLAIPKAVTKLAVISHTGRISAQLSSSLTECEVRTHTGHIILHAETLEAGRFIIRSHVGRIDLRIPLDSKLDVLARCHLGAIDTDLPLSEMTRRDRSLKGSLNGGGAKVEAHSHVGHIFLGTADGASAT